MNKGFELTYQEYGGNTLRVIWPEKISEHILQDIVSLQRVLEENDLTGIIETVKGYHDLTVYFDPGQTNGLDLLEQISWYYKHRGAMLPPPRKWAVPVCYSEEFSLDMEELKAVSGLSREEIIRRHTAQEYSVHLLGFIPGFIYLGGLDEGLRIPRKDHPRRSVPAGAVGIAGEQTGIYPSESPGGWQIIGNAPISLFHAEQDPPCLILPGDHVRFHSISPERHREILALGEDYKLLPDEG